MTVSLGELAVGALRAHENAPAGQEHSRIPATESNASGLAALERAGWEVLGLVGGGAVYHVGVVGWPQGNVEVGQLSQALYGARHKAIDTLRHEGFRLGADGVLKVQVDVHFLQDQRHLPRFVATGTAVRRRAEGATERSANTEVFVTPATGMEFTRLEAAGYRPVGLVLGSCVYHVARRAPSQAAASMNRNGEMTAYTMALYEARELAMQRLQAEARDLGADGVVGVVTTQQAHVWGSRAIEFYAMGTAVRAARSGLHATEAALTVPLNDPVIVTDPAVIIRPPTEPGDGSTP
ncbi:MAG: heavy metal-binding domain-containing protein [Acidimicrobiales bacterium]